MITLTREKTEAAFIAFCEAIFGRPEVENIKVRGVVIQRANFVEAAKKAVALSYHDCCSDVDLGICVRLRGRGGVREGTGADVLSER